MCVCVLGLFECVCVYALCVCMCAARGGGAKMHVRGCTIYIPAAVLFSYLSINMEASIK